MLDDLTVTGANGSTVALTGNTFVMPSADVLISATFSERQNFTMPSTDVFVTAEFGIPVYAITTDCPSAAATGCELETDEEAEAATIKDGAVYATIVNDSFDRRRDYVISCPAEKAEGVLYTSQEVSPHSFFEEKPLAIGSDETGYSFSLPPHSVAALKLL